MLIIAKSVTVKAGFGSFSTLIDTAISLVVIKKGILNIKNPSYSDNKRNEPVNIKRELSKAINIYNNHTQSMELQIRGLRKDLSESNCKKYKLC
ncbi:hypothetical protein BOTNAR_0678g00010 [Botryotinia narcissicola]|uniref:Uncharacterized protein n=1 Tax=Botryotinia narcissicola TaxID=278944 RepID=A0A4Z1H839_9HELO|nr:hypothetical protein BOTNAR_0678g00010 [Botryotinia narcissicola]